MGFAGVWLGGACSDFIGSVVGPTMVCYAICVHASHSITYEVGATLEYAVGGVAYVLLPIGAYVVTVCPDRRMLAAALWPDDPDRRMWRDVVVRWRRRC